MERSDEDTCVGVIKRVKLSPLDRDPMLLMRFIAKRSRPLYLLDGRSRSFHLLLIKATCVIGDPVDSTSTRSMRDILCAFDPTPHVNPRRLKLKRNVEHSPTR